jgi:hypothetical protein
MTHDKIKERYDKVEGLIVKYREELATSITPQRQVRVNSYIHCFKDELEFLKTLYHEPQVEAVEQNFDMTDEDEDEDEDERF